METNGVETSEEVGFLTSEQHHHQVELLANEPEVNVG